MSGSTFTAANGTITGPDGQTFLAAGLGLEDNEVTANTASQILSLLPGTNMVRLGITDQTTPLSATLQAFITQLTSAGVVVEIEDHSAPSAGSGSNVPMGSALTSELNWYTAMAQQYANNPYVWFGTMNEPGDAQNEAAVSTQEGDIYNAIRGAGDNNPILLEQIGGSTSSGLVASDYASMTNVVWDTHVYGWESNYSTNQATVTRALNAQIANAQSITTAEGVVPVIIGEYGPSTNGATTDPNGDQVIAAVQASGVGALAWNWNVGADALANSAGTALTPIGDLVAPFIASHGETGGSGSSTGSGSGSSSGSGSGSSTPGTTQTVTAGGTAGTSTDLSLTGPSSETVAPGASVALSPLTVSDTWAASQSGNMNAYVWDETGNTFSAAGQTTATSLTLTGSLTQINAELATLQYNAASSAAPDTISVAVTNQAGTDVTETIPVTVSSAATSGSGSSSGSGSGSTTPETITLPGTNATTTEDMSNATITATAGNQILFIGGTHDVAILTGGTETVTAKSGYNTITTGAGNDSITIGGTGNVVNAGAGTNSITDDGSSNTIIMPAAGDGKDNIYGSVLTNGDLLNFATALKATSWNGSSSTVSEYLHVNSSNRNAIVSISTTANGSDVTVADLHGAGQTSLSTLLTHSTI